MTTWKIPVFTSVSLRFAGTAPNSGAVRSTVSASESHSMRSRGTVSWLAESRFRSGSISVRSASWPIT